MPAGYRVEGDRLILQVRVQPGARANRVNGIQDGVLRIALQAPALEGRANEALREFLAECLGTAKSRVEILRGEHSRTKTVAVRGARRMPDTLFSPGKSAP